ncbi:MAG: CPBP family intramembrane metalloprotease [Coriobacteriales bacterium]|jgi:membrane protease YdiL (CAAX protease family)|nr:CPBP family intramembrane metalloprotease [Coriobacteriales bacterium]
MYTVFLALLIAFFLIPTIDALIDKQRNKGKPKVITTERIRCRQYLQSAAFLWGAVVVVLIMCLIAKISLEDIGFRALRLDTGWVAIVTLVLWGLALAFFLYQTIRALVSASYRAEAEKGIAGAGNEGIDMVLPRTKKEKWLFSLVSLSAGICEEILYRGFFVFLLQTIFPGIPLYLVVLIPSVLFGASHFYQGVQGVVKTGATGALLMSLFLASGSLIPCIVLHFIMDFSATFLLSEKQEEETEQTASAE